MDPQQPLELNVPRPRGRHKEHERQEDSAHTTATPSAARVPRRTLPYQDPTKTRLHLIGKQSKHSLGSRLENLSCRAHLYLALHVFF